MMRDRVSTRHSTNLEPLAILCNNKTPSTRAQDRSNTTHSQKVLAQDVLLWLSLARLLLTTLGRLYDLYEVLLQLVGVESQLFYLDMAG